ncbi:hypothetical protein PDK03_07175 [Bacillus cereus group sp. TH204-1LC]|uniref:hypothetical protein n=1 Tax=Bacillus cereus group TaxID=86661 RepID=UPI000BFA3A7B|nr:MULTISPECIES: hypothetical protein [Bacillus cereus group]MDA1616378.1 hypothetical protein [Bacillus cereus group sp. TH204-1LC]MDA1977044.1 hypothetical protein [Bacillus cereus]MEC4620877.1 hypothetical protein [Bacillus paranthracis]PFB64498.1 hypothetical protein CN291_17635 [Bacillus cereus]PGT10126.1 hypothetical protein COD03_20360 [Bacillus cereus]
MSGINNTIHDCLFSVTGRTPEQDLMKRVIRLLPASILLLAEHWGPNDTEFRDETLIWISNNKKMLEGELCGIN